MTRRIASVACGVVLSAAVAVGAERFTVTGMGGAGGMYTPTISPYDGRLMLLSCDMSGAYRSLDAGGRWELIHYQQLSGVLRARPAFTTKAIYWADRGTDLRVSLDRGLTWRSVTPGQTPWQGQVTHIAAIDREPTGLLVGTDKGLWSSTDAGRTWAAVAGAGRCDALAAMGAVVYAAVGGSDGASRVLRADFSGGVAWKPVALSREAAGKRVTCLAGAAQPGAAPAMVYATVDGVGIVQSADDGATWRVAAPWNGQNDVLMPAGQTQVAYAAQDNGKEVFRTGDAGKTWESVFHMFGAGQNVQLSWVQTELRWSYKIMPLGLGIDPADGRVVLVSTQGDFYRSRDGGRTWQPIMNEPVGVRPGDAGFRYRSTGLEVTSVWDYVFDPWEANRHYICYTDIGFARSVDAGQTWISATKGCPWGNTFYQIAFDPWQKGRIYAACSNRHDIPHWTHIEANRPNHAGGLCVSDDFGGRWQVLAPSLPKLPCTSIVVDPKSERGRLAMYAGFFEGGLYKSTDGGRTWEKKSEGLGNPGNLHVYRVRIHPPGGNVYCLITAFRKDREFDVPGGLWRSTDGGRTWKDLTAGARLCWPTAFAVHPDDERTIYIAAATAPGKPQGGVWKTTDGGANWRHVLTDADVGKWAPPSYTHGMMVKLHPERADWVYFGSGSHALWLSRDAGGSWSVFKEFPFRSVQNVTFDPKETGVIRVSTFGGGVWTGPSVPE